MKIGLSWNRHERGAILATTLVLTAIMSVTALAMIELSSYRYRAVHGRDNWIQSYYHAENAVEWAAQLIADVDYSGGANAPFLGRYAAADGTLGLDYMRNLVASSQTAFQNAWVTIENHTNHMTNYFLVTASAKVGGKVRTLQASVQKNPPSVVFDSEYFLNNWGWWWGAAITGNGDNRANWDFDFRDGPVINGNVSANGHIAENEQPVDPLGGSPPFRGSAGNDPISYVHAGVPRVPMPNLLDFSYYQQKATDSGGTLSVGHTLVVNGVHNDPTQPGLYLEGTPANPITVNGPVVIPGDVVIKGTLTGVGTLYVGGNLYVAGDLLYAHGPDFSTAPATMSSTNRDQWVQNAVTNKLDLVAFAVRKVILGGDVNSTDWKAWCYDPAVYGLAHVGDESNLGEDGIAGTPDDGVPFRHADGSLSPWYDADGNGVVDSNYSYTTQLRMTATRAAAIARYPATNGVPDSFSSHASNDMNTLNGVFYCNHALAMRLARNNAVFNGAIIARDEAIVFNSTAQFRYDCRIHSRYANDPNRYIDLGLPVANKVALRTFDEIAPEEGYHFSAL
jgi:hypothetical protein